MASPDQTVQPWMATAKKPIWKKWWVWLIVGFAALFILAGIFGSGDTDDASGSDEIVEEELVPMPDLLGERLDVALSDLGIVGIPEDDVELVGGGALGILDESNWIVCEQRPEPGETTLENFRLIVDRTCPEADAAEPQVTPDENVAADPEMTEASEETQEGARSPESPAEFIVSANRDLRDIRKDLNDLETAFSEGGMLRVEGNRVELSFNLAQLNVRDAPVAFADEWAQRLAALSLAIDEIGNQLDADGSPQSVIDAIDGARAEVRTTLAAVENYESSLG